VVEQTCPHPIAFILKAAREIIRFAAESVERFVHMPDRPVGIAVIVCAVVAVVDRVYESINRITALDAGCVVQRVGAYSVRAQLGGALVAVVTVKGD
jgi:hypothetical protein